MRSSKHQQRRCRFRTSQDLNGSALLTHDMRPLNHFNLPVKEVFALRVRVREAARTVRKHRSEERLRQRRQSGYQRFEASSTNIKHDALAITAGDGLRRRTACHTLNSPKRFWVLASLTCTDARREIIVVCIITSIHLCTVGRHPRRDIPRRLPL